MEHKIFAVSQINQYIKQQLDGDLLLQDLCISGELSNYKIYPSGHHYFTLKDAEGALRAVMFRGSAGRLRFRPENGMKVLATGRITVYPRDGAYQLYCNSLVPDGVGDLYVAFEQLKAKLQAEGLFDPTHKKPLPPYPHRIAIITSSAGAAIHDMLRILNRRYPLSKVMLLPVRVQGAEAPAEIAGAIRYANRWHLADVIITGRGGGSMEDLWAFNDERVARMIYASEIPVVSAVGHEPDVTISDFVADRRAATPSNAAEIVAPDQQELRQRLDAAQLRMLQALQKQLQVDRRQVQLLSQARVLQDPMNYVLERRTRLVQLQKQLASAMQQRLAADRERFAKRAAALDAMSPLKVLGRGYALVKNGQKLVKSTNDAKPGDRLNATAIGWHIARHRSTTDGGSTMNNDSMQFEAAVARLEEIVRAMEQGDLPLEQSLQLFEEGTGLVKSCNQLLSQAELKIAQLMKGADGAPVELEFSHANEGE